MRQHAKPSPFSLVGHFTHSLTLRDLRRFFDPNATEINYIPTINYDTSSEAALLPHAVEYAAPVADKNAHVFETEAMRTLDFVLQHMDSKNWDIKHFSTLEKVVHAFHMEETWNKAAKAYKELLKASPAEPDELCHCVLDIEQNGILKFLRFSAMAIREPALVYNMAMGEPGNRGYYIQASYTYHFKKNVEPRFEDLILQDSADTMPPLTGASAWSDWKRIGCTTPEEDYNNALFMFCAVRKSHASL